MRSEAVGDGYAKTFELLCNVAKISAETVTGKVTFDSSTFDHAWNIVELDGKEYIVDVALNDSIVEKLSEDDIIYDYFLVTDDIIKLTHEWSSGSYSKCLNKDYSLKAYKDRGVVVNNSIFIKNTFEKQYKKGDRVITFVYTKQGLPNLEFISEDYGSYSWVYNKIGDNYRLTILFNE